MIVSLPTYICLQGTAPTLGNLHSGGERQVLIAELWGNSVKNGDNAEKNGLILIFHLLLFNIYY